MPSPAELVAWLHSEADALDNDEQGEHRVAVVLHMMRSAAACIEAKGE
jgi:hypothetical protein